MCILCLRVTVCELNEERKDENQRWEIHLLIFFGLLALLSDWQSRGGERREVTSWSVPVPGAKKRDYHVHILSTQVLRDYHRAKKFCLQILEGWGKKLLICTVLDIPVRGNLRKELLLTEVQGGSFIFQSFTAGLFVHIFLSDNSWNVSISKCGLATCRGDRKVSRTQWQIPAVGPGFYCLFLLSGSF